MEFQFNIFFQFFSASKTLWNSKKKSQKGAEKERKFHASFGKIETTKVTPPGPRPQMSVHFWAQTYGRTFSFYIRGCLQLALKNDIKFVFAWPTNTQANLSRGK